VGSQCNPPTPAASSPGFSFPPPLGRQAEIFILVFFPNTDPLPQGRLQPFTLPESCQIPLRPGASEGRSPGWWEGASEGSSAASRRVGMQTSQHPHPCPESPPVSRGAGGSKPPHPHAGTLGHVWLWRVKPPPWFSHVLVLVG